MAKATVLIVEDSPDISESLADAFRFAEFNPSRPPTRFMPSSSPPSIIPT